MQIQKNYKAKINESIYHKTYHFLSTNILNVEITYPIIELISNESASNRINNYYEFLVYKFKRYTSTDFRKIALESYQHSRTNKYPFMYHEAVMNYTTTYNEACKLSTYFDQYQYTGGAHGNTTRSSVNWNLNTGEIIQLEDFFHGFNNWGETIIKELIKLADSQMRTNRFIYFENYRDLIVKNFNPDNYYLTDSGITIYYQQYEIGPYASGIIEFNIPYKNLHLEYPKCED